MILIYYSTNELEKNYQPENFPERVRDHIDDKKDPDAKNQSMRAWELLRLVFQKELHYNMKNMEVTFSDNGKPFTRALYFSIAHSGKVVMVAMSNSNIGLDIEEIKDTEKIRDLAHRLMKNNTDEDIVKFYHAFTSYEASIKYEGKKIGYPRRKLTQKRDVYTSVLNIDGVDYSFSYKGEYAKKIHRFTLEDEQQEV